MTPDALATKWINRDTRHWSVDQQKEFEADIVSAVAAEREACLKIVTEMPKMAFQGTLGMGHDGACMKIAAAIRARRETKEG